LYAVLNKYYTINVAIATLQKAQSWNLQAKMLL
jgi:hypothetical protein